MEKTWSKKLEGPRGPRSHWSGERIPGDQPLSDEAIRSLEAVLSMFSSDLLGFTEQIFDHIEFQVDPVKKSLHPQFQQDDKRRRQNCVTSSPRQILAKCRAFWGG